MNRELWEKCQMLVDAGQGHLVKQFYIEQIESSLTAEQLARLGDLPALMDGMLDSSKVPMRQLVESIIELSERGAILGTKER